jgi:hypothetical protein
MAIICPNGVMQEDQFHQRTFKVPFLTKKKRKAFGQPILFILVKHVCQLDVHKYLIICNVWVFGF